MNNNQNTSSLEVINLNTPEDWEEVKTIHMEISFEDCDECGRVVKTIKPVERTSWHLKNANLINRIRRIQWLRTDEGKAWKKDWDQRYPPGYSAGNAWAQWWTPLMRREKMELKNYAITARVILQENDESNQQVAIEGFLTFSVMAEDFDKASEAAEALLPMDEFKLTGVEEVLS